MRNITVFLVLVIIINCAQFASAQEEQTKAYTFSTSTSFGMFYGQAKEIVYASSNYKSNILSQLLWNIKPVFYYSLSLDFSRAQPMDKWGFFSTLSLKNGIPGKSGIHENRDWMSIENTALTHYSIHDNITNELFFFDASAGLSFPLGKSLLLKTYIAMSYMRFSFTGQKGQGTYARETGGLYSGIFAPIDDDPEYVSFDNWEKVINYTQRWIIGTPGISLAYHSPRRFFTELFFNISPLISCEDLDEHLTNSKVFRDYMRGGIFLEPGFHFVYLIGERLELSMDFSWRYITRTRGETWYGRGIGTANFVQQGEAGAGLSVFNTGLSLKIRL